MGDGPTWGKQGRAGKRKMATREKERAGAAAGPQAGETGWDWAERMRRERGRLGWAGWSLAQIGKRGVFSFYHFFLFHLQNQIQTQTKSNLNRISNSLFNSDIDEKFW